MSDVFTKSMARNIYFGGSVFFILLFLALTFDTSGKTPQRDNHGNVYKRFGNSTEAIAAFIKSRPAEGIPGRRSMPQFNLSDEELNAVAEFLKYSSEINTANWPPNIQG